MKWVSAGVVAAVVGTAHVVIWHDRRWSGLVLAGVAFVAYLMGYLRRGSVKK